MKLFRCLLHIPVGLVTVVAAIVRPVLAICLLVGFLAYELNEDFHIKDNAWVDIAGYLWGLAIGSMILFLILLGGYS